MDRILVYSPHEDRSQRAIALASRLAERSGARLTILRVLEEGPRWKAPRFEREGREMRDLLVDAETRELEQLAAPLSTRGLQVDVRVSWGVPWDVIVGLVDAERIDLVVKPARGLSREGRVFFGSTALHLFRKCVCPVWVVGDDGQLPTKILAAIDPARDSGRTEVAERILGWANRVGELVDAPMHVGSAWHAPGADALEGKIPESELKDYVEESLADARESLDALLDTADQRPSPELVHLVEGPARDVLPRFAEENAYDLIVMGTLGRTGIAGEVLGETAEMILRDVRASVLTISPRSIKPRPERID
jgi:nucleotide-binding universal stress UspA family protein